MDLSTEATPAVNAAMRSLFSIEDFLEDMSHDPRNNDICQDVFDARAFIIANVADYQEAAIRLAMGEEPEVDVPFSIDPDTFAVGKTAPFPSIPAGSIIIGDLSGLMDLLGRRIAEEPRSSVSPILREAVRMTIKARLPELQFTTGALTEAMRAILPTMPADSRGNLPAEYHEDLVSKVADYLQTIPASMDDFLTLAGTDAAKWAKEWMRIYNTLPESEVDEGWMIGWFANAIEAGRNAGWDRAKGGENAILEKRISRLKNIMEIQSSPGNYDVNDYMRGFANGIILGYGTMTDTEPKYHEMPEAKPIIVPHELRPLFDAVETYHTLKRVESRVPGKQLRAARDVILDEFEALVGNLAIGAGIVDPPKGTVSDLGRAVQSARVVIADGKVIKSNYASVELGSYLPFCMTYQEIEDTLRHLFPANTRIEILTAEFIKYVESHADDTDTRLHVKVDDMGKASIARHGMPIASRHDHLFNHQDGRRGRTNVSVSFATLYRIIHEKLETLRAPGNVRDFFDVDAKCQQICVAIEQSMGIYPNTSSIITDAEGGPTHYVHFNGAAYFVKTAEMFKQQGGDADAWGRAWRPVTATSIEHARTIAKTLSWDQPTIPRIKVPEGQTPLDDNLGHRLLDVIREGEKSRDSGAASPYHGHSLEHCLHAHGWVQRDLRIDLDRLKEGSPRDDQLDALLYALREWVGEVSLQVTTGERPAHPDGTPHMGKFETEELWRRASTWLTAHPEAGKQRGPSKSRPGKI